MSTTVSLEDIPDAVGPDNNEYESSGDEYTPSRDKLEEVEGIKWTTRPAHPQEGAISGNVKRTRTKMDDIPLADVCQKLNGDWDDEDNIPLASFVLEKADGRDEILANVLERSVWTDVPFQPPHAVFTGSLEQAPEDGILKAPYEYFKELITDEILDNVEGQTNIYSLQKEGMSRSTKTTRKETEVFIGICLRMGLIQAHCVRAYWDSGTRYTPVVDAMPIERFTTTYPRQSYPASSISDVRYGGADHLSEWGPRGHCKQGNCRSLSFVKCIKCDVFLCLNKDRNCFLAFYKK